MHINRTSRKTVNTQRAFVAGHYNLAAMRGPAKSFAAVALSLLLSVPVLAQVQYRFSTIDVPGATRSEANGNSTREIAGDFDVVVNGVTHTHGFVLNKGVFTTIDAPGAEGGTVINGINVFGWLAGTSFDASGAAHAFFENKGYFTPLNPPFSSQSQAGFINTLGQVAGSYLDRSENLRSRGFIWRNGTFITFREPDDEATGGTVAFGINDFGEVVGAYRGAIDLNRHGFLRGRKGDFKPFDVPKADRTVGEGINDFGTIVGFYRDKATQLFHGFLLNKGDFTTVDVPDPISGHALQTEAQSINAKGEIVGVYIDSIGEQHGFLAIPVRRGNIN
jgi:uncharacterized membrane protein